MNAVEYALGVPGWMREVELAWLAYTAAALPSRAVWLEVGTWMGRSWAATALSLPPDSTIIAVDTFRGEVGEPRVYVEEHGPVLAEFIRIHEDIRAKRPDLASQVLAMSSFRASEFVPDRICDAIFIDGDHRTAAVSDDLRIWAPKLKLGGLMCGHDSDDPEVLKALKGTRWTSDPSARGSIWILE